MQLTLSSLIVTVRVNHSNKQVSHASHKRHFLSRLARLIPDLWFVLILRPLLLAKIWMLLVRMPSATDFSAHSEIYMYPLQKQKQKQKQNKQKKL